MIAGKFPKSFDLTKKLSRFHKFLILLWSHYERFTSEPLFQSFDTANQRFSELAAAQDFFSDFISDSN